MSIETNGEFQHEIWQLELEFSRQWAKWGDQRHADFKWVTILAEEVGEAAQNILDGREVYAYRELIQVAAVALNHARTIRLRRGEDD